MEGMKQRVKEGWVDGREEISCDKDKSDEGKTKVLKKVKGGKCRNRETGRKCRR